MLTRGLLGLCLSIAACTGSAQPPGRGRTTGARPDDDGPEHGPRLVVLVVVDQFPAWAFEAKRPALTHGFARLLAEGDWRTGVHPSVAATTAAGHTLLGTGEPPARSGIIANEWWSREEDRLVKVTDGPDGAPSTRFLRVPGLGDALLAAGRGGKAVGVALKIRAARLPLGHHGLALYYDATAGTWRSHGGEPGWLAAYQREHPVAGRLASWTPLDPARVAQLSGTIDAQRGEVGTKGFGPTFPHDPARTPSPTEAVVAMPLGNDLTLDLATAAIDGEQLGADRVADLLVVSLSAHDYVAHYWGHESWEAWDAALRLDVRLDRFLADLDQRVGAGRWALVLTSDHGGTPLPERTGGGRYTVEQIQRAANAAASAVLGRGEWIASASYPNVWLSKAALAQPKREIENVKKKIVFALRSFPGLGVVDRLEAYAGRCEARAGDARAICLALDPARSGDVVYWPAKHWVMSEEHDQVATAHGSLTDEDRRVPVLVLPPDRARHAPPTAPSSELSLEEIAPLLARWLGVTPPSQLPRTP